MLTFGATNPDNLVVGRLLGVAGLRLYDSGSGGRLPMGGVTGAAVGVLPGVLVHLTIAVRLLTRHSTVTPGDLWSAVWPSVVTSAVMCAAVLGVEAALQTVVFRPWLVLLAMIVTAGISYSALLLWTPFPTVAALVRESVDDLAPWVRRWITVGALRIRARDGVDPVVDPVPGAGGSAVDEKVTSWL